MVVRVQAGAFDPGVEVSTFSTGLENAGAIVTFTGVVRDVPGGLDHMEIEHYPAMTEKALMSIESQATERWGLESSLIIHRYGVLKPGELIMMVATAAPHRVAAFEATQFLMDYLKSRAPFWKKEITLTGETWVAAKDEDEDALRRW